ncbi:FKBP12-associated protein [Rhizina undulata]
MAAVDGAFAPPFEPNTNSQSSGAEPQRNRPGRHNRRSKGKDKASNESGHQSENGEGPTQTRHTGGARDKGKDKAPAARPGDIDGHAVAESGNPHRRNNPPVVYTNPNALAEFSNREKICSMDLPAAASYNNWGDSQASSSRPPDSGESQSISEGPPPAGSVKPPRNRRGAKGKGNDRGGPVQSQTQSHQKQQQRPKQQRNMPPHNLPAGSHILGEAPKGIIPNQRRGPPPPDGDRRKQSRVPAARTFGGQLTVNGDDDAGPSGSGSSLRPEAATFEPGKQTDSQASSQPPNILGPGGSNNNRRNQQSGPSRQQSGRGGFNGRGRGPQNLESKYGKFESKQFPVVKNMMPQTGTNSDDIITRIHKEISSGEYECMICFNTLNRRSKIWNCKCCWAVFHTGCINKWAKQGLENPPTRRIGMAEGEIPRRSWRCPACNNPEEEVPDNYTCWCEKTVHPEISKYLPPHSCGQTCGKKRSLPKNCPHACDLQCHAGPCQPCTALGPQQSCFCGKETSQRRCADTDYENGWSCGHVCGDFMPCGDHTCTKPCHPGLCGACEELEELRCYCGHEIKEVKCCDKQDPKTGTISEEHGIEKWEGYWECEKICGRYFDCGKHRCQKRCHPQDSDPAHCKLSPDVIAHCPCGKTRIDQILSSPRISCQDPIPTCGKACGKTLKCGHKCTQTCHDGECGMCFQKVEITCRCGRTVLTSACHQGEEFEPPQCFRNCKVTLNCGRHECGEKCCAGDQKAQERLASKRKMKPFNSATPGLQNDDGFEPEHICTRSCGRLLKCGNHNCPMLCHRGPCGTCLEASFEELYCNCGQTAIQPPVPCGTKPPPCNLPCARPVECGHPPVKHNCHTDEQSCPKCPYLTEKPCICGKKILRSIPCWSKVVSCGMECGKKLSCGSHLCHKTCHDGRCDEPCRQKCGKAKSSCGHPCMDLCHAPFQCPEDKPCVTKVQLSCPCEGLKQEVKCGATKANPIGNRKELKCNDQCRSRRMALALSLDPDREAIPPYSDETISYYIKNRDWATAVEQKFRNFANNQTSKRNGFQPMRSSQRAFLHKLAADYGLESESQDPEPYRSVVIRKGSNFTAAPKKLISEFIAARASTASAAVVAAPVAIQQLKKSRKQPVNAILLQNIRVGILTSELEKELDPVLKESQLRFNLNWSGDEDVLLEPKVSSLAMDQMESELGNLSSKLKRHVAAHGLAESVELCWVGRDGQIANREDQRWSLVANRKAAPTAKLQQNTVSTDNGFGVFGSVGEPSMAMERQKSAEFTVLKGKKREVDVVDVVDDWETAADEDAKIGGEMAE